MSLLAGIEESHPNSDITVFDFRNGTRTVSIEINGKPIEYRCHGANRSKRLYSRSSQWNIALSARLGAVGNPAARLLLNADAVLDLSAGDSFSDLYGTSRFESILFPKILALRHKIPLVLLPQTYGPFKSVEARQRASEIVKRSTSAWARDGDSFKALKELAGNEVDSSRYKSGVDLAFSLRPSKPKHNIPPTIDDWLLKRKGERTNPVIGLNISGLIYLAEEGSVRANYGFISSYREMIHSLLQCLIEKTDARIVLVPHVLSPVGSHESDLEACLKAKESIPKSNRLAILNCEYRADEIKFVIGSFDFFCGTRMHSTIASLSMCVPTTAIAYSMKTKGVFDTCGQGNYVFDARSCTAKDAVDGILEAYNRRDVAAKYLETSMPAINRFAAQQLQEIVEECGNYRA